MLLCRQREVRLTTGQDSYVAPAVATTRLARDNSSTMHVGAATPRAGGARANMIERMRRVQ